MQLWSTSLRLGIGRFSTLGLASSCPHAGGCHPCRRRAGDRPTSAVQSQAAVPDHDVGDSRGFRLCDLVGEILYSLAVALARGVGWNFLPPDVSFRSNSRRRFGDAPRGSWRYPLGISLKKGLSFLPAIVRLGAG